MRSLARWLGSFHCGFCCVRGVLCQTPFCKMCASYSSDGSDEEDSEQPNMWNVDIGTLYALGNQPEVATRAGGLGNVSGWH